MNETLNLQRSDIVLKMLLLFIITDELIHRYYGSKHIDMHEHMSDLFFINPNKLTGEIRI